MLRAIRDWNLKGDSPRGWSVLLKFVTLGMLGKLDRFRLAREPEPFPGTRATKGHGIANDGLDAAAEIDDVTVLDDVVLALEPLEVAGLRFAERSGLLEL